MFCIKNDNLFCIYYTAVNFHIDSQYNKLIKIIIATRAPNNYFQKVLKVFARKKIWSLAN